MAELDVAEAPAEEQPAELPAPSEAPAEAAPPAEEPAPAPAEAPPADPAPVVDQSAFEKFVVNTEARLAALEGAAHSSHNFSLDQSAVEEIAAHVLASLNSIISKHLA